VLLCEGGGGGKEKKKKKKNKKPKKKKKHICRAQYHHFSVRSAAGALHTETSKKGERGKKRKEKMKEKRGFLMLSTPLIVATIILDRASQSVIKPSLSEQRIRPEWEGKGKEGEKN